MCAAPEVHQYEPPVERGRDNVEHSGSLLPRKLTPGSGGTLAANRKSEFRDNSLFTQSLNTVLTVKYHTAIWLPTCFSFVFCFFLTHWVVLANELEDRDLVVLRELVLGRVLCHSFIRNTAV